MKELLIRGVVFAIGSIILFWIGGFVWLKNGSDWPDIEAALKSDPRVETIASSAVDSISPMFWGYSYGFRGTDGHAEFVAEIVAGGHRPKVDVALTKEGGQWRVLRVTEVGA